MSPLMQWLCICIKFLYRCLWYFTYFSKLICQIFTYMKNSLIIFFVPKNRSEGAKLILGMNECVYCALQVDWHPMLNVSLCVSGIGSRSTSKCLPIMHGWMNIFFYLKIVTRMTVTGGMKQMQMKRKYVNNVK